eukprot:1962369-Rhodomonas_salina.1
MRLEAREAHPTAVTSPSAVPRARAPTQRNLTRSTGTGNTAPGPDTRNLHVNRQQHWQPQQPNTAAPHAFFEESMGLSGRLEGSELLAGRGGAGGQCVCPRAPCDSEL